MKDISAELQAAFKANIREIHARVKLNFSDITLDSSVSSYSPTAIEPDFTYQMTNGNTVTEYKWLSMDGIGDMSGEWSMQPIDTTRNDLQVGYWSDTISDADGYITAGFIITSTGRGITDFTITGDNYRAEYPVDFDVIFTDENGDIVGTESITDNTDVEIEYTLTTPLSDIVKIEVSISRWSESLTNAKGISFTTELSKTYSESDIESFSVLEESEISNDNSIPTGNISYSSCSLSLVNRDRQFDINNIVSPLYGNIKPNTKVDIELGAKTLTANETILIEEDFVSTDFTTKDYIDVDGYVGMYPTYENKLRLATSFANAVSYNLTEGYYTANVATGQTATKFDLSDTNLPEGDYTVYYEISIAMNYIEARDLLVTTTKWFTVSGALSGSIDFTVSNSGGTGFWFFPLAADKDTDFTIKYTIVPKGYPELQEWDGSSLIKTTDSDIVSQSFSLANVNNIDGSTQIAARFYHDNIPNDILRVYKEATPSSVSGFFFRMNNSTTSVDYRTSVADGDIFTITKSSGMAYLYHNETLVSSLSTEDGDFTGTTFFATSEAAYDITQFATSIEESTGYSTGTIISENLVYVAGIEYFDFFSGWTGGFDSPDASMLVTTTAYDRLNRLTLTTMSPTAVLFSQTVGDICELILNDHGLSAQYIDIDSRLYESAYTIPMYFIASGTHLEELKRVSEAMSLSVYSTNDIITIDSIEALSFNLTSQEEYTRSDYTNKTNKALYDTLINNMCVPYAPFFIQDSTTVYESSTSEPDTVDAATDTTLQFVFDQDTCVSHVLTETLPTGVTITEENYYSDRAIITFNNTSTSSQEVTISIDAQYYEKDNLKEYCTSDVDSIEENGESEFTFTESDLIQTLGVADTIGDYVLATYKDPFRDVTVQLTNAGNPALELTDKITVTDRYTSKSYNIVKKDTTYDGGLSMTLGAKISALTVYDLIDDNGNNITDNDGNELIMLLSSVDNTYQLVDNNSNEIVTNAGYNLAIGGV